MFNDLAKNTLPRPKAEKNGRCVPASGTTISFSSQIEEEQVANLDQSRPDHIMKLSIQFLTLTIAMAALTVSQAKMGGGLDSRRHLQSGQCEICSKRVIRSSAHARQIPNSDTTAPHLLDQWAEVPRAAIYAFLCPLSSAPSVSLLVQRTSGTTARSTSVESLCKALPS